ncbi:class I SAM-dependent methyltransferase, partial [Streptomyces sp. DH12]|uniref:class I SAM-dependent methyltransferase n=1 Tax=Streptomyces sp. DH12 TaxID=2857010 RepID=UPI001E2E1672
MDLSTSMTSRAAARLPGAVVRADSRRLPFRDVCFDAVVSVWLLHLLADPADVRAVVAECARVLRPGGVYVTTVHKGLSHNVGSDIDAVLAGRPPSPVPDDPATVAACAAGHGLVPAGEARFRGHGQGRSPRRTVDDLRRGWFVTLPPGHPLVEEFAATVRDRGGIVALGGCVEIGADGLPFAPFSTALRQLRRELPDQLTAAADGQEEE